MAREIGEIIVNQRLNEYEFGVTLRIMRSGLNRNKWDYQNIEKYYQTFAGQPILCAFPDGRIGDGHTMEEKVDENGEAYYSFIGPNSEKIVGTISEDVKDLQLVEEDGETWIEAKGRLFAFYAKELVDYIVAEGRMDVSAETIVSESHMNGSVEVFTEWVGLAVTVLGKGVAPAIPGANIKALQEIEAEFKELKLKAASLHIHADTEEEKTQKPLAVNEETKNEPQPTNKERNGKALNIFSKKQLAELAPKFEDYAVLSAGQDDAGIHVCLMSRTGDTAVYTMEAVEDLIDPNKIKRVNTKATFAADEWSLSVDTDFMMDDLSATIIATNSELETTKSELQTAKDTIQAMTEKELKRRVSAAKAKAMSTLEAFNANREDKVDASILTKINECIDNGDYSECVDAEGDWCGEEAVMNEVLAACAKEVMEIDKKSALARNSQFVWDGVSKVSTAGSGDVGELLAEFGIN